MFMGTYTHAMDEKGRLIIPARIREELGEGFILTKNLDHCLGIYPAEGWKKFVEAVGTLPKISSEAMPIRSSILLTMVGAILRVTRSGSDSPAGNTTALNLGVDNSVGVLYMKGGTLDMGSTQIGICEWNTSHRDGLGVVTLDGADAKLHKLNDELADRR